MAERRMFAKTIVDSDAFLDMPLSTQALYFHLSMRADDEGFINNPKKIQRMIGCNGDDLKLLMAKKFILAFESGVIVIKHWKIHNYIRSDRIKETIYREEKKLISEKANGAYTFQHVNTLALQDVSDNRQTSDGQMSAQDRLGKDRLGKDRLVNTMSDLSDRIPYKEVIDYLNKKTNKNFRNVETTKKVIRARWNEGNRLDDFKKVIDIKSDEWLSDEKMSKYVQPSTLFGTKFDQYLNQKTKKKEGKGYGTDEYDNLF